MKAVVSAHVAVPCLGELPVRKPRRAFGRCRLDPDARRNHTRRLQEAEGEDGSVGGDNDLELRGPVEHPKVGAEAPLPADHGGAVLARDRDARLDGAVRVANDAHANATCTAVQRERQAVPGDCDGHGDDGAALIPRKSVALKCCEA